MLSRRRFLTAAVAGGAAVVLPGHAAWRRDVTSSVILVPDRRLNAASTSTLPTPDELFAYLQTSVAKLLSPDPTKLGPIGTRGRVLAWYWSYWGRALVFAYRA